jgi:hypothetical protein
VRIGLATLVFIVSSCAFLPALRFDYNNFDDHGMLMENLGYQGLGLENLRWMFTATAMGHYQPLAWLSFAIEYSIAGLNPTVSHTVNVAIHAANAVLVMLLAGKLIRIAGGEKAARYENIGAVGAALLFAVHPLRVESVAWVTERRDVLSLFFYLAAVLAYLWAFPRGSVEAVSRGRYLLTIALFLLSLLSKAWAMSFFVVLLMLDVYPLGRLNWSGIVRFDRATSRVLNQKLPFAAAGIGWMFIAGVAQHSTPGTVRTMEQWGIVSRISQASYGLMFYIWKTLIPTKLAALYELPKTISPTEPRVLFGFAVTGLLAVIAVLARRRVPALSVAILCYIIIVLPVLGIFQAGIQLVADRYSYISMVPMAIVAGAGIGILAYRARAKVLVLAPASLFIAVLFALSWVQTGYWRDARTLLGRAIEVGQDGHILRAAYGRQLADVNLDEAVVQIRRAIELDPFYGEAWYDLACILKDQNKLQEAKLAFEKASQYMPDSWRADQLLGLMYAKDYDDMDTALKLFQSAVRKIEGPESGWFQPTPYITLAQALYDFGDIEGAKQELRKALQFRETHDKAEAALRMIAGGGGGGK